MRDWNDRWGALETACDSHSAVLPFHRDDAGAKPNLLVGTPATEDEIRAVEARLECNLPVSLRTVLLTYAASVDVAWQLPEGGMPPEPFDEVLGGACRWNIERLVEAEEGRRSTVVNVFADPGNEYDRVWHGCLAFSEVPNGDYLAIDDESGRVVYLSHDDGEGHGYVLANDFEDFVDRWSRLGCVGPEDWMWLPFTDGPDSGLLPDCENAIAWRQWFGLDV